MKKSLLLLCYLLLTTKGLAYDFMIDGIYYNTFVTENGLEAEVTFASYNYNSYSGKIIIPSNIVCGESYKVTSIADSAFKGCVGLTSLTIGENVTSIGKDVFEGCLKFKEFIVSEGNTKYTTIDGVLFIIYEMGDVSKYLKLHTYPCGRSGAYIIPDGIKRIGDSAFSSCVGLTSIEIPDECKSLGSYAFKGCTGLTSIKIPNECSIDSYAFAECTGLTSIVIPDYAFSIGYNAFMNCTSLISVFISDTVRASFLYNAFHGCTRLKEFIASDNCVNYSTVDGVLFSKDKINLLMCPMGKSGTFTIPDGTKYIIGSSFSKCSAITSITIPGSVYSIGESAFSNCTGLTSITIADGLKKISDSAFSDCSSLTSIVIPNSVSSIGKALLSGCITLHKLSLPFIGSSLDKPLDSSRSLGYLFMSKTFKYPAQEDKIEGYIAILYGSTGQFSNKHAYYIPISLKEINVTNQMQLSDGSDDHRIFPGVFGGCTNLETINLPLTTTIGKYAFRTCSNLKSLSLPIAKSINYTQELTFPKSLISLNIGSLEGLSSEMLSNLSKLEELTIPFVGTGVKETATGVQGLFGDLFSADSNSGMKATTQYYQDSKSKTYYLPVNLKKVTVTEECEELQYGAFYGCSTIKEITLPYTLYMVGEKALYGCAGLTDIYCKGAAPAAAYDNSFTGIRVTTCKLHIPYNTTDLYKASDGWKKFFYMQEEAPLTVNVTKNILNAGIILGITEYQQGVIVNLSARANSGYRFKCWMDNREIVSEEDNYSFTINENKNLLAVFIPVQNENSLIINTESNAVNFTWETIDDTNEYILKIYSDIDMKKEIASYQFDAEGELVTRTASELSFRMTDLKPEVTYYYSLIANDKSNKTLSEQIGTFSTTPTSIEDISTSSNICIRVEGSSLWIENAQEKMISIYNLQGVCQTVIHKAKDMEMIQIDHSGIYLIKVDKLLQKVIIK
ncbi:leucine-rich repeat protein [Bacteroides nordii]|uniref:leucine-rich repeat domain-containing protein n=1 Tax=Bacteroides nordii TaxID=291645 RepID=UPI00399A4551